MRADPSDPAYVRWQELGRMTKADLHAIVRGYIDQGRLLANPRQRRYNKSDLISLVMWIEGHQ